MRTRAEVCDRGVILETSATTLTNRINMTEDAAPEQSFQVLRIETRFWVGDCRVRGLMRFRERLLFCDGSECIAHTLHRELPELEQGCRSILALSFAPVGRSGVREAGNACFHPPVLSSEALYAERMARSWSARARAPGTQVLRRDSLSCALS